MATTSWQDYPVGLQSYDPTFFDEDAHAQRLRQLSEDVFQDNYTSVCVIEGTAQQTAGPVFLRNEKDLHEKLLHEPSPVASRIISIHQDDSSEPLNISMDCMKRILHKYEVMPEFLEVILQFGFRPSIFQHNSGSISFKKSGEGVYNICYTLPYIEENGKPAPNDPVSQRQTGVFHRYDAPKREELAILLHPKPNSKVQKRLECTSRLHTAKTQHPLNIHCLVLSSYLVNWGPYLERLAGQFTSLHYKVLAVNIENDTPDDPALRSNMFTVLRSLEDKIVFRSLGGLNVAVKVVDALFAFNQRLYHDGFLDAEAYSNMEDSLNTYSQTLQGHLRSAEIMAKRLSSTIDSLSSLLELRKQLIDSKNQRATEDLNRVMCKLNFTMLNYTREAVDDNKTIKLITVVTLIYLPASFVTSLLGTELFSFNDETKKLEKSKDFWIFFALALPLTALTLSVGWLWVWRRRRRFNHEDPEMMQVQHVLTQNTKSESV